MILQSSQLQEFSAAICLSYAEILVLSKVALMSVIATHQDTAKQIRKAAIKIATLRALKAVVKERRSGQVKPKTEKFHKLLAEAKDSEDFDNMRRKSKNLVAM